MTLESWFVDELVFFGGDRNGDMCVGPVLSQMHAAVEMGGA